MAISKDDLDALLSALDRGRQLWIEGRLSEGTRVAQADDMTLFGPFGGESPRLTAADLSAVQQRAASQFAGGTGACEVVKTIVSGDLAVVIMIERNEVQLRGHDEMQPWVLRTTQAFRLDENGHWWRLHRHADPLIRFRPGEETFALAGEPSD
jgi:ketosteroid isomerase-like protein